MVRIPMFKPSALALALLLAPWGTWAAGLGKLVVQSNLGQPLKAEIDVVSVSKEEAGSLRAASDLVDRLSTTIV